MKNLYLFIVLLNLLSLRSFEQEIEIITEADSLRGLGQTFYHISPNKCINLLDSAAALYEIAGNKKQQALCYQNIAFAYQEKLDNIDKAIPFINKAIPIWAEIRDSLNQANILKYLGMLQGKIGEYDTGKETIKKAICLFDKMKFNAGIAVSYYDLALLYESENQIDSCISYLNKNKIYFETIQDTFRIFNANNRLFEIYLKNKMFTSASEIYEYNLRMENSNQVYWQQLIDYYRICIKYYDLIDNADFVSLFQRKYNQLRDSLANQEIIVK